MVRLTKNIDECVNSIKEGNIIVFPTETVYGMGADIFNEIAVNKIYDYKKPYSQFLLLRDEIKEKQLQAQKNQDKEIKQTEQLIEKFRYKASKAAFAQSLIKKLEKVNSKLNKVIKSYEQ